jgi:glycosyltransferase involved in cell wall biosynthesis
MNIILAHNFFNPIGGAEVFYHEVGRVLEEHGHEVAYFSPADENINSKYKRYFPKAVDYKDKNIFKSIINFKNMVYSSEAKEKFKMLINDFKPDLVHAFAIYTRLTPSILDICKEYDLPVVMSCNDYKHICPNYKLYHHRHLCEDCKDGKFYNVIKNRCLKNSLVYSTAASIEAYIHNYLNIYKKNVDLFLFSSVFMAKKTEEFWGKDSFEWSILKNPFESNQFEYSPEYEDYCIFFGRLIDEKGVDILIEAMKHIPQCNLKIVGNGPDEEQLRNNAKNLNNVEFLGPKWNDDLNLILKKAKFVIVPSTWHENFPYVILQSFALGKAVIGTNRGGIPELVKDGEYGLIYDALNPIELSEKITSLWNNPEIFTEMGRKAKNFMNNEFNDKNFYNEIMTNYKKVLK